MTDLQVLLVLTFAIIVSFAYLALCDRVRE